MDPADLFSMRWTTTTDFDFGLPPAAGDDSPSSPMLVSASQIIRDGRLLPCEPARRSLVVQAQADHETDRVTRSTASSPAYHSAQSTPASLSSCSSTRSVAAGNKHNANKPPPPLVAAGRRSSSRTSSWKILLSYLRFLMPLYRKIRALPRVAPASPARASTSSLEWCHGNADTAVRDAILYCKKSSVRPLSLKQIHLTVLRIIYSAL
ncbi:hypothetical protein PR202_ga27244 [Eleusine coracana subsp. coracana]|uniref:Uncharacterized protein n=1 Tax=Eleusine coracana subsp. coracana TaxID=191504 RepID=A0AAV5DGB6_ELECO|nr:hypothetical protein PR202_ga27244 [Eleusine coracana subsp. coracana]